MPVVKQCCCCSHHIYNRIRDSNRVPDDNIYFYMCVSCRKKDNLLSKTECLQKYRITNFNLNNLKTLYFPNKKNLIKYYYKSEIESFNFPLRIKKIKINNEKL